MCYVQSCPPKEDIFGGFCEAISEKFCGIFFFLVLVYWIKFGKIEERANQRWLTRNTIYSLLIYYTCSCESDLWSALFYFLL